MAEFRQDWVSFPILTSNPTTAVQGMPATAMQSPPEPYVWPERFAFEVRLAGTGSCKLQLWGYTAGAGGAGWGQVVDPNGNTGKVANDFVFAGPGAYFFVLENLCVFDRFALVQHSNQGGTPTVTARIAQLTEKIEVR